MRRAEFLVRSVVVAVAFISVPSVSSGQKRRRERPPVSWVNPMLPNGPGLTHKVLEDTPHNLGLYYERTGKKMAAFLGEHLTN